MHTGNLMFSQLMEFAPWHTFRRLVAKYRGDFNVRTFSCLDQFLCNGIDLSETVYALDSTTIDLCLSLFPWVGIPTNSATYSDPNRPPVPKDSGHPFRS